MTVPLECDFSAGAAAVSEFFGSVIPGPELRREHWYAAYTCSRYEKCVAKQLEERRVECFLPLYRSWRRWKDRRKQVDLALFPGYVFVRIAVQERLRVLELPGVVRLVSFNGQPAPLPEQDIEALRNGLERRIYAEPHPYLRVGRRVRVRSGPMAGMEGVLVRRKDKFRVVLSIHLIQRSIAVEVDEADIDPIR
jgi:transcription antitermination factor NusG